MAVFVTNYGCLAQKQLELRVLQQNSNPYKTGIFILSLGSSCFHAKLQVSHYLQSLLLLLLLLLFVLLLLQDILEVVAASDRSICAGLCGRVKQLLQPVHAGLYPQGPLGGTALDRAAPRPSGARDKDKESKVWFDIKSVLLG